MSLTHLDLNSNGEEHRLPTPTKKLVKKLMNSRIKKPYGGATRGTGEERVYPFDQLLASYLVDVFDELDALGYTIEKKKDDNTND